MANRFLIVAGRFNDLITKNLLDGAQAVFRDAGVSDAAVDVMWVPGAFEMPVVAAEAGRSKKYAAVLCLGAVIRGETPHFDYVAGQCASGLMAASVQTGVPMIFGVLTTDTVEQALNRAGLKVGNKGADAAHTALTMTGVMSKLNEWSKR